MATGTTEAKEERKPRHIDLNEAISNDLSHSVNRLEILRDRLAGSEKPQEKASDSTCSSPADVYENAPSEIRTLADQIDLLTRDIRKMVL